MAAARNKRRRRRGRGRFGPLFKLLCALAVLVALTMGATVFFQVESVEVTGNSRYTRDEVVQATGIQVGDNLFHMNKYQIADRVLEELPYSKELSIRRRLPSTIVITMSEWEGVAVVQAPASGTVVEEEDAGGQTAPLEVAGEDWIISVNGKLLEPAGEDVRGILITGITPIMPRAGTKLALPQVEQPKLEGLLALMAELEKLEMMGQVSSIRLDSTQVVMRYMDRFNVEMPLNSDFNYKLRTLEAAVAEMEKKLGGETTGTFDLTQENYTAVYSPE